MRLKRKKKSVAMTLYRFFHVLVEALGRREKKIPVPEAMAIFKREIF
jgi:hypothetical protein